MEVWDDNFPPLVLRVSNYFWILEETTPPADTQEPIEQPTNKLPWAPKIRRKDIDIFLNTSRSKFIGYILKDDQQTLAGLPQPIQEGFYTLKKVIFNVFEETD